MSSIDIIIQHTVGNIEGSGIVVSVVDNVFVVCVVDVEWMRGDDGGVVIVLFPKTNKNFFCYIFLKLILKVSLFLQFSFIQCVIIIIIFFFSNSVPEQQLF